MKNPSSVVFIVFLSKSALYKCNRRSKLNYMFINHLQ